jgi:hypothetical protein
MLKRISLKRAACILAALLACVALGDARVRQPNAEYQARRAKLRAAVNAPVVLFGYTAEKTLPSSKHSSRKTISIT